MPWTNGQTPSPRRGVFILVAGRANKAIAPSAGACRQNRACRYRSFTLAVRLEGARCHRSVFVMTYSLISLVAGGWGSAGAAAAFGFTRIEIVPVQNGVKRQEIGSLRLPAPKGA